MKVSKLLSGVAAVSTKFIPQCEIRAPGSRTESTLRDETRAVNRDEYGILAGRHDR